MKVVIVNGTAGAGKDTFIEYCTKANDGAAAVTSMVDYAKDVAEYVDWDGKKTPKNRKFLSDLKDLLDNWSDCSFKYVKRYIENCDDDSSRWGENDKFIVFVMARQPDDIARLALKFDAVTICVRNNKAELENPSNHADANVFDYDYDYYIDNNGTLEELKETAANFIEILGKVDNHYVRSN